MMKVEAARELLQDQITKSVPGVGSRELLDAIDELIRARIREERHNWPADAIGTKVV
jgi:hypothetical protein